MTKISIYLKSFFVLIAVALWTTITATPVANSTAEIQTGKVNVGGHEMVYTSAGKGPNVLLVHGFLATNEQWQSMMQYLAAQGYRVVAPDLPGYGQSLGYPEKDYQLEQEVDLLHQFVTQLQLAPVNIAGSSMGGMIVALYAKKYPSEVTTLAFIGSPLGVQSPKPSPADQLRAKGINSILPSNEKEFWQEMNLLYTHPPVIDQKTVAEQLKQFLPERDKFARVSATFKNYRSLFNKPFDVKAPTLILWGDADKIFDVSGADILKNNIANSRLIIIKNGSHLLNVEQPEAAGKNYVEFLDSHAKQ